MLEKSPTILPGRIWWLGMLLLLICAGTLRFTGYNFSLPYIDHVDEASYNIAARMVVDFGSPMPIGMHGYPPGIIAVNHIFIRLFHDPADPPGAVLWMVRLVSVAFSLGCVVAVGLLAFRAASPLAGGLAAGLWAIAPVIVEHSRYGTADNFVTFFTLMALFLALTGTRFDRNDLLNGGLIAALLAVVFKYQAIFVLPLILILPLWRLTNRRIPRARVLKTTGTHLIVLGLYAFWLILLFPALEATSSPDWTAATERLGIPTLSEIVDNFHVTRAALASDPVWLLSWLGIVAFVLSPIRRRVDGLALAVVVLGAVTWLIGISFYGALGPQQIRQFITVGALMVILRAIGLTGWALVVLLIWRHAGNEQITRLSRVASVLLIAFSLVLGSGDINASIANAREHTLPDRRNDLAAYFDSTLEGGRIVATTENHKTLNRGWGGYAGREEFPLEAIAALESRPIDDWRGAGVRYAIVPYFTYELINRAAETGVPVESTVARGELYSIPPTLRDELLLLKSYPPSTDYRGPSMVVYRLEPITHPLDVTLGSLHFVGYDLEPGSPAPGETVALRLYWRADAPLPGDFAVFNHWVDASGTLIAQADGDPLPAMRGTSDWDDPTETLVSRIFELTVPADAAPGAIHWIAGFYLREDGRRFTASDDTDQVVVAELAIE
ncbi:MAG: glycosyltransferase family 39 protein [Chloroflexi bacterium]|nr:glycosyltransferase family 39 protein [Chloroflexota bacterium]